MTIIDYNYVKSKQTISTKRNEKIKGKIGKL